MKLFNLLTAGLEPNLLERGVIVRREDLKSLFMSLPQDSGAKCKRAQAEGREIGGNHLLKWLDKSELVLLRIDGDEGGN